MYNFKTKHIELNHKLLNQLSFNSFYNHDLINIDSFTHYITFFLSVLNDFNIKQSICLMEVKNNQAVLYPLFLDPNEKNVISNESKEYIEKLLLQKNIFPILCGKYFDSHKQFFDLDIYSSRSNNLKTIDIFHNKLKDFFSQRKKQNSKINNDEVITISHLLNSFRDSPKLFLESNIIEDGESNFILQSALNYDFELEESAIEAILYSGKLTCYKETMNEHIRYYTPLLFLFQRAINHSLENNLKLKNGQLFLSQFKTIIDTISERTHHLFRSYSFIDNQVANEIFKNLTTDINDDNEFIYARYFLDSGTILKDSVSKLKHIVDTEINHNMLQNKSFLSPQLFNVKEKQLTPIYDNTLNNNISSILEQLTYKIDSNNNKNTIYFKLQDMHIINVFIDSGNLEKFNNILEHKDVSKYFNDLGMSDIQYKYNNENKQVIVNYKMIDNKQDINNIHKKLVEIFLILREQMIPTSLSSDFMNEISEHEYLEKFMSFLSILYISIDKENLTKKIRENFLIDTFDNNISNKRIKNKI